MRVRFAAGVVFSCLAWTGSAVAHRLEPISTEFARPFRPKTGSFQFNYEYERRGQFRSHFFPAVELEFGLVPRMQIALEMPLQREKAPGEPATWTGGHMGVAVRYLVAGGEGKHYAVSLNPFLESPTGNRRITGDAYETGAFLNIDREFGERLLFHGNYGWSTTVGGTEEAERAFHFRSALVIPASRRWNPTVEFLGQTDLRSGRTEFVVQPEMIYYINSHWELKVGVPLGATASSPGVGVKAQVAWIFGRGSD